MILPRSGSVFGANALIPSDTPAAMFVPPRVDAVDGRFSAALSVRLCKSLATVVEVDNGGAVLGSSPLTKSFAAVGGSPRVVRRHRP